ncbi:hypothetical protein F2Q69_00047903 [Brassica cretica]|uniref:Uncharacterized protein n=1 Tax=Brassica cretica TaxID=69181 RepID=A0A8S9PMF8_BRACR|nr:hypothetical protein F2Q69_00047903 [Brassica cretica]
MASEKFGPHLPMILEAKHIEAIYELWESIMPSRSNFLMMMKLRRLRGRGTVGPTCSIPLPRFLLEALAELGMAFAQMAPNFFRYFLASWIRAREEGLEFGLEELKKLDDRWREKFFVFKINPASVGDFDFRRIPWEGSGGIEPFGPAPMNPELHGLIATLRRGSPRWLTFTVDQIRAAYALPLGGNRATPIGLAALVRPGKGRRNKRAREKEALPDHPDESSEVGSLERAQKARRGPTLRSRSQAQSPGLLARPVSIAVPVGGVRRAPNTSAGSIGDRALDDDGSGLPLPLRASGEGTSQVNPSAHLPDVHETSSWRFSYDNEVPILENPESLALIWHKIREKGCKLSSLGDTRERDGYVRMAVANAKAMEASNEYAALMERRLSDFPSKEEVGVEVEGLKGKLAATEMEKVAVQNDLDSMKEKHRREIEDCNAAARKEHNLARRSLSREYDAVLAVVKDKLRKKKKETAAEIRLQELRARIEALTKYSEGGF